MGAWTALQAVRGAGASRSSMRSGRAALGRRPATRRGSRGPRTGSTGSTSAGRARHGLNGSPSAMRSARAASSRPASCGSRIARTASRPRRWRRCATWACRRSGSKSTRRRVAGRRSPSTTWRSRSSSPRAVCSWRVDRLRQSPGGWRNSVACRGGRSATRTLTAHGSSTSSSATADVSSATSSSSPAAPGCRRCSPRSPAISSRSPSRTWCSSGRAPATASRRRTPVLDRLRRLVLRRSRDRRAGLQDRARPLRRAVRSLVGRSDRRSRLDPPRPRLPGPPLPGPRRWADPRDPHLPVRDDAGHELRDRPPSRVRQRVAGRRRVGPRLQAWAGHRPLRQPAAGRSRRRGRRASVPDRPAAHPGRHGAGARRVIDEGSS